MTFSVALQNIRDIHNGFLTLLGFVSLLLLPSFHQMIWLVWLLFCELILTNCKVKEVDGIYSIIFLQNKKWRDAALQDIQIQKHPGLVHTSFSATNFGDFSKWVWKLPSLPKLMMSHYFNSTVCKNEREFQQRKGKRYIRYIILFLCCG